jgi:16S rRNA (guanine527-N7)-methyltransferase
VTAVDAVAKKIIFLRQLCRALQLQQVDCIASRIEALEPCQTAYEKTSHCFDVIVSRAVGTLPHLIELALPFLAPEGSLLLQRGGQAPQELKEHAMFLEDKGLTVKEHREFQMSWLDHPRHLVSLHKSPPQTHDENGKIFARISTFLPLFIMAYK